MVRNFAGTLAIESTVVKPKNLDELLQIINSAQNNGLAITIQGNLLSYGDSAMPTKNSLTLQMTEFNKILAYNAKEGALTVQAGVKLAEILILCLPDNWLLPVIPGEHQVTVGGAIANNVHGKTTWKYGNFSTAIKSLKVLLADGQILQITSKSHPDLFAGIVGGIGALGIILEAELQLMRVPSAFVEVEVIPTESLQQTIDVLRDSSQTHELLIAWSDMFPRGQQMGRGFIERGKFCCPENKCTAAEIENSLYKDKKLFGLLPFSFVWFCLSFVWGRRFLWFLNKYLYFESKIKASRGLKTLLITDFLFIHNKLPNMKDVYKPHGFYEFQPLLPISANIQAASELMLICQKHRFESLLCGIKIQKHDEFLISYSGEGVSIGIDVHAGEKTEAEVNAFVAEMVELTRKYKGRIFLAKDQWLKKEQVKTVFPNYDKFLELKKKYDKQNIFVTKQIQRIGLSEPR